MVADVVGGGGGGVGVDIVGAEVGADAAVVGVGVVEFLFEVDPEESAAEGGGLGGGLGGEEEGGAF